jgi:histidinol-phosphatase
MQSAKVKMKDAAVSGMPQSAPDNTELNFSMTSDIPQLSRRLDFAVDASRQAGKLILGYYQQEGLNVDLKQDESPVTAADRGAEELIRRLVDESFSQDGVLGEEFGEKPSANGFRWILDPVDGTQSFVHGVPLFGTLIGLEYQGEVVAGVCRIPALNEVAYAARGQEPGGRPASASRVARVSPRCRG